MTVHLNPSFHQHMLMLAKNVQKALSTTWARQAFWVNTHGMDVYYRVGQRLIPKVGDKVTTLEIANIQMELPGQGTFKALLKECVEVLCPAAHLEAIYIENVFNKRFAEYFRAREEWVEVPRPPGVGSDWPPSFILDLRKL